MTTNSLLMKNLWQDMPTEPASTTPRQIKAEAKKRFEAVRRRNAIEYIACALVVVICLTHIWSGETLLRQAAASLLLIGTCIAGWNLHKRAGAMQAPDTSVVDDLISFQISDLQRQRDAIKSAWLWYLAPLVPGLGIWVLDYWMRMSLGAFSEGERLMTVVLSTLLIGATFVGICVYQLLHAAHLQRQSDHLTRLRSD